MTKPHTDFELSLDVPPPLESITIATPVGRLEQIIADAMASGEEMTKYLARKLREGEVSKTEVVETLLYAVSLDTTSGSSAYH